ncbi:hypothetical protein EC957_006967 [Mortierella hygrophila]|uniref:Uncharacterized protein n=1 Tax=Mortierella hygrophila TaxID=979708 RepID=A0A9P6K6G0_9FUNG|nr:hypothetical protein EC957_006967 [Mortierella hygrophila]
MILKRSNRSLKETLTAHTTIVIMAPIAVLGEKSTRELNPSHRKADALALAEKAKVRDRAYAKLDTRHRRGACSTDRQRRSLRQK